MRLEKHDNPTENVVTAEARRLRLPALFWMTILAIFMIGIAGGLTLWIPQLQRDRAIAEIQGHGGVVFVDPSRARNWIRLLNSGDNSVLAIDLSAADLTDDDLAILREFEGVRRLHIAGGRLTDAGLEHLHHLAELEVLLLVGCGELSTRGEEDLKLQIPRLVISRRGPALLGIVGRRHPAGCMIIDVRPGTAAASAGLARHDIITVFDGNRVRDFSSLTDLIARRKPGDRVDMTVYRRGQRLELTAKLGDWRSSRQEP